MFKSLNPALLGVSGRQSELIELALTFGFRSLEIEIDDMVKKAEKQSVEHATRFFSSGQLRLGTCELPIQWRGAEEEFKSELAALDQVAQVVASAGATVCHTQIEPGSDVLPYHDNFELHRKRLNEMAEVLDKHDLRLGLSLQPLPALRANKEFQFIFEAEALILLMKTVAASNVGLYLDTWNWHFGGGTIEHLSSLDSGQIVGLTLADAEQGVELETATPEQRLLPSEEGTIDLVGIIRQLHNQGVRCPVTLAPGPESFPGITRENVVQKCGQILDSLLGEAGEATAEPESALTS